MTREYDRWREFVDPRTRRPTHPGHYVREERESRGLSQDALAEMLKTSRLTVNEIERGRRNVTTMMALRLARLFGTSVDLWTNLQRSYDIYHWLREDAAALRSIEPLR